MKFVDYIQHLKNINWLKYNLRVNLYDLNFRYKNIKSDLEYKLEVYGIVDFIETKEYLIFSDTKTSDYGIWPVRIPEINNKFNSIWNSYKVWGSTNVPSATTYNNLPGRISKNISHLPDLQAIYTGIDYENLIENNTGYLETPGNSLGVYLNASNTVFTSQNSNQAGNRLDLTDLNYINVNTNESIGSYVTQYYNSYGTHPGLTVSYDSETFPDEPQRYFFIPMGISGYNVILTSLTNGEKSIVRIQGTLQDNPLYSGVPRISINTQGLPVGASTSSLNLDAPGARPRTATASAAPPPPPATGSFFAILPNVVGMQRATAKAALSSAGFNYVVEYYQNNQNAIANSVWNMTPPAGTLWAKTSQVIITLDI